MMKSLNRIIRPVNSQNAKANFSPWISTTYLKTTAKQLSNTLQTFLCGTPSASGLWLSTGQKGFREKAYCAGRNSEEKPFLNLLYCY